MRLLQCCLTVAVISLFAQHAHSAEPGTASKSLIGKWNLDTAAVLKQMEENAKTDEEKQALTFAKPLMSSMKMQMEFTADGVMAVTMKAFGKDETKKGTYKVKSEKENSLVVLGTMDNDTKEVQMSFPKADVLQLTIPEDKSPLKSMIFNRAKKEASN
jgi:hypothetical protein